MIDQELLQILACPETKAPVRLASPEEIDSVNDRIRAGGVATRGGDRVEQELEGGLIREDGAVLYPIRDEIPIMLIDEAIVLSAEA